MEGFYLEAIDIILKFSRHQLLIKTTITKSYIKMHINKIANSCLYLGSLVFSNKKIECCSQLSFETSNFTFIH